MDLIINTMANILIFTLISFSIPSMLFAIGIYSALKYKKQNWERISKRQFANGIKNYLNS